MTTEELEKILEAGTETQVLDFKESHPWSAVKFAKDILAMTNVQEGGTIVVGVVEKPDNSFERQGILPQHKSTYNKDVMKDQIASYADPHVDFFLDFPKDKQGKEYVVITIQPFQEIPVICKRDRGTDLKEGGIYYRNRNKRAQSSLVSTSNDMRDIIERAAVKSMQRWKTIGLVPSEIQRMGGLTIPANQNLTIGNSLEDILSKELGAL